MPKITAADRERIADETGVPAWAQDEPPKTAATLGKVKPTGRGGLDEGEALCAAVGLDPYLPKHDDEWRNLGPDRVDPASKGSKNLWLLRRATAYIRTAGAVQLRHRAALVQWLRDQLSARNGFLDSEVGWCHYGALDIAAIAVVAVFAAQRGHQELLELCLAWFAVAVAWFVLAAFPSTGGQPDRERGTTALWVMPVGLRKQGLSGAVQATQLAQLLRLACDRLKVAAFVGPGGRKKDQSSWWPCQVLDWALARGLSLPDEVAISAERTLRGENPELMLAVPVLGQSTIGDLLRVRARFRVWRWERGAAAAWLREEKEPPWINYGSGGQAADVTATASHTLEVDPGRQPRPATCRASLERDVWVAVAAHEGGAAEKILGLDARPLGRLLWIATATPGAPLHVDTKGPATLDPVPAATDLRSPW